MIQKIDVACMVVCALSTYVCALPIETRTDAMAPSETVVPSTQNATKQQYTTTSSKSSEDVVAEEAKVNTTAPYYGTTTTNQPNITGHEVPTTITATSASAPSSSSSAAAAAATATTTATARESDSSTIREKRATSEPSSNSILGIFDPCEGDNEPVDLPSVVNVIRQVEAKVKEIMDVLSIDRIANDGMVSFLKNVGADQIGLSVDMYSDTEGELMDSLTMVNTTLRNMLLNQLRYTVYVNHALRDEMVLRPQVSLKDQLHQLNAQLMPSLSCALLQHALHAQPGSGTIIDKAMMEEVDLIKYTLPTQGMMMSTYEAFILMNNLHNNFFSFVLSFFVQLDM